MPFLTCWYAKKDISSQICSVFHAKRLNDYRVLLKIWHSLYNDLILSLSIIIYIIKYIISVFSSLLLDLLPYYAILRSIPNKLLGVVAILGSLLILLAMPLLDTSRVRGGQFRPLWRSAFWTLAVTLVLLGYLGSCHAEEPYVTISAIATCVYFSWYLILVPLVGVIENTLIDLDRSLF